MFYVRFFCGFSKSCPKQLVQTRIIASSGNCFFWNFGANLLEMTKNDLAYLSTSSINNKYVVKFYEGFIQTLTIIQTNYRLRLKSEPSENSLIFSNVLFCFVFIFN